MKKQSGITLVALIITIIVMVILAGVVIVTAVMDGGIIDKAQTALRENERAEVEDIVIASYVYKTTASMNTVGQLDLEETAKALYSNLTGSNYKIKTVVEIKNTNKSKIGKIKVYLKDNIIKEIPIYTKQKEEKKSLLTKLKELILR